MCGRLNVNDDPFSQWVCDALSVPFQTPTNHDLRPTQVVATISSQVQHLQQVNASWGIKPNWAQKPLINAQAETVAVKPTFRHAFAAYRCVVPCSGFYEWQTITGGKQKWLFECKSGRPLFMAGILYPVPQQKPQLVTLTTKPAHRFAQYHHRFPQFIHTDNIKLFLATDVDCALRIMTTNDDNEIVVKKS